MQKSVIQRKKRVIQREKHVIQFFSTFCFGQHFFTLNNTFLRRIPRFAMDNTPQAWTPQAWTLSRTRGIQDFILSL